MGCDKTFKENGLLTHMRQTRNPLCWRKYWEFIGLPQDPSSPSSNAPSESKSHASDNVLDAMDIVESMLDPSSPQDGASELAFADIDIEDTDLRIVLDESDVELEDALELQEEDEEAEDEDGVYF